MVRTGSLASSLSAAIRLTRLTPRCCLPAATLSIYRDFDPLIYTDIDPPWESGDFQ